MKKCILALTMLVAAIPAHAGILDKLKKTPATQYELGAFKLSLGAYMLTEKLKGERMADSGFKVVKFRTDEKDGKLFFIVSGIGKAKYMSEDACSTYQKAFSSNGIFDSLITDVWPNLTEQEYRELGKSVLPAVELISKENNQFKITCS